MFTPSLFHALRGSRVSQNKGQCFSEFITVLFPQKFLWLFSTLQQKIASTHENHYRISKGLIKSLRLIECLPVLYIPLLSVLGVKCFPYNSCESCILGCGDCILCLIILIFFLQLANQRCWNCSLCQLTAVADYKWTPLGPARVQKCSLVFFWLWVSSAINSNPSPENPSSSLDTSNPCSQPVALGIHCKTHRHSLQHLWCPGL